jgi:tetratricopeptide (TPR) repeat protein
VGLAYLFSYAAILAPQSTAVKVGEGRRVAVVTMDDSALSDQPEQSDLLPSSTSIGRDQVNVKDSPGAIVGSVSGDVHQHFGTQHTVNTSGGAYVVIHYHGVTAPLHADPAVLEAAHAHVAALPLETVPQVATLPPGSRMPLSPNPLFVGREAELRSLAQTLQGGGTAAIGPIAAATGLGGIGKTQLAAEVAHRYGQYFAGGVFWMSFASADSVPAEIAACGGPGALNLSGFDGLTLDSQVATVIQAWQSPLPRLLIFDNCEDEALLDTWRPKSGGCRVLVTSRRAQWDVSLGVATLALQTLPHAQGIALLRKFRPDLSETDPDLAAIADEMGDLPLALHLAGSFLAKYRHVITPAAYLAQVRDPALLQHRSLRGSGISPTGHDLDVGRTFALSYKQLDPTDSTDALAMQLLARAAHFAPGEPIPRALLTATVEAADEDAALQREDGVERLIAFGLLESETDGALRLHRLLGVFVRATAGDDAALAAAEDAMLQEARRLNNAGYPAPLVALQTHLRFISDRAGTRSDTKAAYLYLALGWHLTAIGDYRGARPYFEQALAICRMVWGEHDINTATSLNELGRLLRAQGDLAGAHLHLEQALAIYRAVLGDEHPNTATSLNNLGFLFQAQGDLAGARSYFEQALAIRQAVLGDEHFDTATSLNNLGVVLQAQGDLAGARSYFEPAVEIYRAVLGDEHPTTAIGLNNLGALLNEQGDLAGARSYLEQALAIKLTTLGEQHTSTATTLNRLGMLLLAQGDFAGARSYLEQALTIYRAALGDEHAYTAQSLNNLGVVLRDQGDLAGARSYFEQALVICEDSLGPNHATTQTLRTNLNKLLADLGRSDPASDGAPAS